MEPRGGKEGTADESTHGTLGIGTTCNVLVVEVLGYRSRGPGSIPGATKFSE
jgi:hypothetical protein